MAVFVFRGQNRKGERVSGERAADSRQALALALRREQILLVDAQEKKVTTGGRFEFGGNPTPKDVAVFTRQLSVMIGSGVPPVQCLRVLADTQKNRKFAAAIKGVTTEVESGNSLAEDEELSKGFRCAVHQHGCGGRNGWYSRHDLPAVIPFTLKKPSN